PGVVEFSSGHAAPGCRERWGALPPARAGRPPCIEPGLPEQLPLWTEWSGVVRHAIGFGDVPFVADAGDDRKPLSLDVRDGFEHVRIIQRRLPTSDGPLSGRMVASTPGNKGQYH